MASRLASAVLLLLGLTQALPLASGSELEEAGLPAEVNAFLRQLSSDGNDTAEVTTTDAAGTTSMSTSMSVTWGNESTTTTEGAETETTADQTTTPVIPEATTTAPKATTLTSTTPMADSVTLELTVSGLNYAAIQADSSLEAAITRAITTGVVQELNTQQAGLNLTESDVETTLSPAASRRLQTQGVRGVRGLQGGRGLQGSSATTDIVARSVVTLPATSDASTLLSTVASASAELASTVRSKIGAVENIASATLAGASIEVSGAITVSVTPAPTSTGEVPTAGAARADAVASCLAASLLMLFLV